MSKRYWLVKSEPDVYPLSQLERDGRTGWTGVRNFQARNFMRDEMKQGELVLYYHSNAKPPGVAGLARVVDGPAPDPTQFDRKSPYYDATSDRAAPRWVMAQLGFVETFPALVPLEVLKADPALDGMPLLQKGQRLSVQPVPAAHFARVLKLAKAKTSASR